MLVIRYDLNGTGPLQNLLDRERALSFLDEIAVFVELASQIEAHRFTPNLRRNLTMPRSAWVCTVLFETPSVVATSLIAQS
jgi:hypothetical protein